MVWKVSDRAQAFDLAGGQLKLLVEDAQRDRLKIENAADRNCAPHSRMIGDQSREMPTRGPTADVDVVGIKIEFTGTIEKKVQRAAHLGNDIGQACFRSQRVSGERNVHAK